MKNFNQTKIRENIQALGTSAPVRINDMDKRGNVRKLLNGLGFTTEQYIDLNMGQLETIYNGLLALDGSVLMVINGCDTEHRSSAVMEFDSVARHMGNVPSLPSAVVQAPVNVVHAPKSEDKAAQLAKILADLMSGSAVLDENRVIELVKANAPKSEIDMDQVIALVKKHSVSMPTEIKIMAGESERVIKTGLHHELLPALIRALATGCNIMLVGPAGSGKTTLAHQAALALGVDFYFNGAIASEYKLTGFIDAQGRIVSTAFRKAYENGGVYLFDEIDASMPDALLAFNAALANGHMDFPDGTVKRHERFYCIAAANTFGKGADRVYVGRNQLDAASLDRFIVLTVDYDEKLEKALAQNDNWTDKIQAIRRKVSEHKIRHVVSPRASINGAKMLLAGFTEAEVLETVVFKGMDADSKRKIA